MNDSVLPALPAREHATLPNKRAGFPVRAPETLPVYVTAEEARRIINAAGGIRDRLLLETIWQTGGRITEVLRLRVGDVDAEIGTIQMDNLKQHRGGVEGAERPAPKKVVYVSLDLASALRAYAKDHYRRLPDVLFTSRESKGRPISRFQAYRIITTAAQEAGVYKMHPRSGDLAPAWPHTFRHGAAKHLLEQTLRLDYVQDQLGHASLNTTKGYLRLGDPEKRRLRDQVSY